MPSAKNDRVNRLAEAIKFSQRPEGPRFYIDKMGTTYKNIRSSSFPARVYKYATERRKTVANLMILGEKMRDAGAFDRFGNKRDVQITSAGAYWQAFQGTAEWPACHTSPGLLLFNKFLPHLLPQWAQIPGQYAVQIRIIVTFAHCILMPELVNRIDQALDESFGEESLVESMEMIRDGASARDGICNYQRKMIEVYRPLLELSPSDLARALGRLRQANPDDPHPELTSTSRSSKTWEDEIIDKLDDPTHKVVRTYLKVNETEVPRSDIEIVGKQIDAEMRIKESSVEREEENGPGRPKRP